MALVRRHKTSSSRSGVGYDVFLSFRGEDTRKTFTDHLYSALVNAGFRTFRDDPELERGENIKQKLEKAIQQSLSSVIVFSKDYTSSRWCLDELVMILEHKRTSSDHVVLPIFYHVKPSDVRNPAEILANVPKCQNSQWSDKLNGWREALRDVADLAGMVLENEADGHESKFIQNLVKVIQDKIGRVPLSHVQEVLQKKLSSLYTVMDDAEGKQLNNPTVKDWLDELKEAVYDAEDLLQEIKTEALRQKMEPKSGSSTTTVQELVSSPPSHAFDSALIISKAEEVLERLEDIMKRRKHIQGLKASAGHRVSQTLPSTSLVEDSGVYGRDEEKEAFIKLLLSEDETGNKISVIPIVGMGGIGKTTLAQLLYNDVRVKQRFDLQAWACVSKEFDVLRISQHIYESLTSYACQTENLDLLQSELKKILVGKKFFFVLDDIWNKNYTRWDFLRCPFEFGAHGSKIIVTTRNEDVASMMGTVQAHHLRQISEDNGWLLFEKHAFKNAGVGAHSDLEVIGRQIVRKCNGLPLALKSLGGLLCSKLISEEWESILNNDMWELPQEESDILPSLWLSYMYLPAHLKRCFAYCSIFPKNYRFQKSDLVSLWKAHDLLQPKKKKMVEEVGEEYFNILISRSFLQHSLQYHIPDFIMHDLICDLAKFVSGEFCVRWEDNDSATIVSKTRHFSYMKKLGDRSEKFEALHQAKYLRTFLSLPKHTCYMQKSKANKFQRVLYAVLPELQCLRMLNLSGYKDFKKLPESIKNLKHLRHMDMSRTSIRKLPGTICTLYNLQVLLLTDCNALVELPTNLSRLINLSHLDIRGTKLEMMPPDMGNLKDLQVLSNFVLAKCTALELKKLQNLRGTLSISGLGNFVHGSALEDNILTDKKFLNELVLHWNVSSTSENDYSHYTILDKLQPHLNLERLTINCYGGNVFPGWSVFYSSSALVYLNISNCLNCTSLPPLGQLPSLRELYITRLNRLVSIGSEFFCGEKTTCVNKPFRSLQVLRFNYMSMWQEWSYIGGADNERGVFPNLVELSVLDCPFLTGRLALDYFPMLDSLHLSKTNLSIITSSQGFKPLSLTLLKLHDCSNIVSFPEGGLQAPNLIKIEILRCEELRSWPEQMHTLLPTLESLWIKDCPELESFPVGELPSKLESLYIVDCKKLGTNRMWNVKKSLRRLTYLTALEFDFDFAECEQVEEGFFPSTLTYLKIRRLSCKTMDKWFGHLNSLQTLRIGSCSALQYLPESGLPNSLKTLEIHYCSELQCLPESGLPNSLSYLSIDKCPLLEKRCQREKGEDWPKIAHIPCIMIDELRM